MNRMTKMTCGRFMSRRGGRGTARGIEKEHKQWKIFYANARGITSKKLSLIDIIGELKPEIALFAETMLKTTNQFVINGYSYIGKQRTSRAAGGVGILVKNEFKEIITPHQTDTDIEIIWVSIKRKTSRPVFIGVYYGKQESRNNRDEMLSEMDKLSSDIHGKINEGEVILFMDGNGKIGLLGEEVSRNGSLLLNVFSECNLEIMNQSDVCEGQITRVNRRNTSEKSAIDFVLATAEAKEMIQKVTIDENCEYVLKGSSASDHNSIIVDMKVNEITISKKQKITKWRLGAPINKWEQFDELLQTKSNTCKTITQNNQRNIDKTYEQWKQLITNCAMKTIGKTTITTNKNQKESFVVKSLRKEKQQARRDFQTETNPTRKVTLKEKYISKQIQLRTQIMEEENRNQEIKFTRMTAQGSVGFWKEMKKLNRDTLSQWSCIKKDDGTRILDFEMQKEEVAQYYEKLYSFDQDLLQHPYHETIKQKMVEFTNNRDYDDLWYNQPPTKRAIEQVICAKKDKKATTDFPNEFFKRGGKGIIDCLYPIIRLFWESETPPRDWNEGIITNVWKGKGDREKLKFQRGITVSSSISMICEQLINERMTDLVPMSQAQGGGKKGCSTRDHVFILRGAITHALKNKTNLYVTFYDVTKAYDRADVDDMLIIAWEHGLKGKLWRLMKNLNTNLTAKIKMRQEFTRSIERKAGGKQGGKNFGFLFAKMMDVLAEEMENNSSLGITINELHLPILEWVDDVVTFAEGQNQQNITLKCVDTFAVKHKLKWGKEKCKVMEIGSGSVTPRTWMLGQEEIESCETYKYLGDVIMRNGGNKKNLEEREVRVMTCTRKIMALCGNGPFKRIQLKALLKMHNCCTIPMLLSNCETWILNKTEKTKIERIELWALKKILGVPKTTPSVAIWHTTGLLTTTTLIDKRQMIYLKTILDKPETDWTTLMLKSLENDNIGWAKQVQKTLEMYGLKENWADIRSMPLSHWKRKVTAVTEEKNKERLIEMCQSAKGDKMKTKSLLTKLGDEQYARRPCMRTLNSDRLSARLRIMARYHMLDCRRNFKKGYGGDLCNVCKTIDDENHRINYCTKYKERNLALSPIKFDFESIYSDNEETVKRALEVISHLWNVENGENSMKL